jgi:hypothetical protein
MRASTTSWQAKSTQAGTAGAGPYTILVAAAGTMICRSAHPTSKERSNPCISSTFASPARSNTQRVPAALPGCQHPQLQYLDIEAAIDHCARGASIWHWAGNDEGFEPDVVLASAGDIPTMETLAAAHWLRRNVPEIRDWTWTEG